MPRAPIDLVTLLAAPRDDDRLAGILPELRAVLHVFQTHLTRLGCPKLLVVEGFRSCARQKELFAQGRTLPGKIVTSVICPDATHPRGQAVDLAFVDSHPYADTHPWQLIGEACKLVGLRWGGAWGDFGHVEIPVPSTKENHTCPSPSTATPRKRRR